MSSKSHGQGFCQQTFIMALKGYIHANCYTLLNTAQCMVLLKATDMLLIPFGDNVTGPCKHQLTDCQLNRVTSVYLFKLLIKIKNQNHHAEILDQLAIHISETLRPNRLLD